VSGVGSLTTETGGGGVRRAGAVHGDVRWARRMKRVDWTGRAQDKIHLTYNGFLIKS
jgi:hypothetical protein